MRIVVPGGTGQVGGILRRAFAAQGHDVVVLSRSPRPLEPGVRSVAWDARTLGDWRDEVDGADVVVNLAGRSVNCRYTDAHLREMMWSRVESTRVVGEAMARAARPPAVWLQASTATIYADSRGREQDEATGVIGGDEPGVPLSWEYSVRIARRWEAALQAPDLPHTRRVAMRTAIVMSPDRGGAFDALSMLTRVGAGGAVAGGGQYVSWLHDHDLVRAVDFLIHHDDLDGPVNLTAPEPLLQATFQRELRRAWDVRLGLPATAGMVRLGAWALRTEPELLRKSRRVVPGRLLGAGLEFAFPSWSLAVDDLVARTRTRPEGTALMPTVRAMANV
ncbi:epimerase [Jatrophihabitans sp. YIM 134969]